MGSELKRLHHPYDLSGRWYKIFLESNGTDEQITTSDIDGITLTTNAIKFPIGFHVLDKVYDIHSVEITSQVSMALDLFGFPDTSQGIFKPVAKAFDYANIYVYGYFE